MLPFGVAVDDQIISIHALREEGDMAFLMFDSSRFRFLSTPSARRATRRATAVTAFQYISIHALREEGDCAIRLYGRAKEVFLSTPSARRATHILSLIHI